MNKTAARHIKQFQGQMAIRSLIAFQWAIRNIPRRCTQWFVDALLPIAFLGIKNLRSISIKNLQTAYGRCKNPDKYTAMTKRCLINIGHSMMDLLYFVERPEELSKIVHLHSEKNLKEALQLNRGVVAVTAHFGNFPLMFVSLVQRGYKVNVIIRPMRDKDFSKFMYDLCAKWNINMIPISPKKRFVRESLAVLRRNELLFFLLDEAVPKEAGVMVDFFNRKVPRSTGPLLFHERVGSPVVPMFIVQNEKKDFEIFIEQSLKIEKKFSVAENYVKNISKLTSIIESFVRKYPFQWGGWLNKRWNLQ